MSQEVKSEESSNRLREDLALALLFYPSLERAAAFLGISEEAATRMSCTREFQHEYLAARSRAMSLAMGVLQQATAGAVATLMQQTMDRKASGSTRMHAAKAILQYSMKAHELGDLELRIQMLEEEMAAQNQKQANQKKANW